MIELLFWFSSAFIIYTYLGYPCILFVWSKVFPKKVNKKYLDTDRTVSIIIAARNEERHIGSRIENIIGQHYPSEKMEIIVVSDGSMDATNDIVLKFIRNPVKKKLDGANMVSSARLKLIHYPERRGKAQAINLATEQAKGEFLILTDARQRFKPTAIKELLANFYDPEIGCVSGELIFNENPHSSIQSEMSFYWNLEKWIRKMESAVHSVPGATGSIYALRKELFRPIPEETLLDDVLIPMNSVMQGYRTIFDSEAIAYDIISKDFSQEKRRKVRTLLGNYRLLRTTPQLLSPSKNPIFLFYISHKVFRLLIPFFFLILLISSFIAPGFIYKAVFIAAIVILLLSLVDIIVSRPPFLGWLTTYAKTFVFLNYFALLAFIYFIRPGKKKVW